MKVVHINCYDTGGAANAVIRLHQGLLMCGIESHIIFLYKTKNNIRNTHQYQLKQQNLIKKFLSYKNFKLQEYKKEKIKKQSNQNPLFTLAESIYEVNEHPLVKNADIIHLHWVANFVNINSFFTKLRGKKIVWTLHDMNPITGGCHYSWDCTGFTKACGNCPQLGSGERNLFDLSYKSHLLKKNSLQEMHLTFVANSNWLKAQVMKSTIVNQKHNVAMINYGLDATGFHPKDKKFCKMKLNIPDTYFVICIGAVSLDYTIKGFQIFINALDELKKKYKIYCLIFGSGQLPIGAHNNVIINQLGYVENVEDQAIAYSAADVFVIPSLQESFGQTALEAMACATPVIGSKVGGIPDMVKDYETGLLFIPGDVYDLVSKIEWMINNPEDRCEMGDNARRLVEEKFTLNIQAENYIQLYNQLLSV